MRSFKKSESTQPSLFHFFSPNKTVLPSSITQQLLDTQDENAEIKNEELITLSTTADASSITTEVEDTIVHSTNTIQSVSFPNSVFESDQVVETNDIDEPIRPKKRGRYVKYLNPDSGEDNNENEISHQITYKINDGIIDNTSSLCLKKSRLSGGQLSTPLTHHILSSSLSPNHKTDTFIVKTETELPLLSNTIVSHNLKMESENSPTSRQIQSELNVFQLTLEEGESVWPKLGLQPSTVCSIAKSKVLSDMQVNHSLTEMSSNCLMFDWQKWLQELPMYSHSLYFREYSQIIQIGLATTNETKEFLNKKSNKFPTWLLPQNLRDQDKKRPDDETYNVGTMWVPTKGSIDAKAEPKHFTPAMEQYWEIKAHHFDKIVFFKIGKFYEIFYIDAFIANRLCNLRWMGSDEKPHVGFPEVSLHHYAQALVTNGFKVVVVEQMETPKELEARNRLSEGGSLIKSKAVKRDICEVFSIGTLLHEGMLPSEARVLLSLVYDQSKNNFGFSFADISTCRVWVGHWDIDNNALFDKGLSTFTPMHGICNQTTQALKSLLYEICPVEIVFDQTNVPSDMIKLFKQLPLPPHMNTVPIHLTDQLTYFKDVSQLIGSGLLTGDNSSSQTLVDNKKIIDYMETHLNTAGNSFSLLIRYLDTMLLKDKVLGFGRLEQFDMFGTLHHHQTIQSPSHVVSSSTVRVNTQRSQHHRLIMDSSTLRHLNIIQNEYGTIKGTLFEYIDHTVTPIGKRLLKRWITAPLVCCIEINKRLDVVEWFLKNEEKLVAYRDSIGRLPDVERLLAKVCTRGLQGFRGAVYFDDIHSKHFSQFVHLLDSFCIIQTSLLELTTQQSCSQHNTVFPEKLHYKLCQTSVSVNSTTDTIENNVLIRMVPNLQHIANNIKESMIHDPVGNQWSLALGIDKEYDTLKELMDKTKQELDHYLNIFLNDFQQNNPKCPIGMIRYVHTKYRYEIEIPEDHLFWEFIQQKDSTSMHVTSSRVGYIRCRTNTICNYVETMDDLELRLKDSLYGCQQRLFQRFYQQHYDSCLYMISLMAEMDILSSFAIIASSGVSTNDRQSPLDEIMCRPIFINTDSSNNISDSCKETHSIVKPILRLIHSRHPIVASSLPPGTQYVTNNIVLNDESNVDEKESFLLVTGPNMGGKSTLLRQTCLSVILAQIGSYVPASECILSPVDRIFTRIGAYDSILEGRSAFLVELEEASPALSQATSQSLIIMDELGRGTSTCDGAAIALAVAEHIATVIKARCLFSTHFQLLSDELESISSVRQVHMSLSLDEKASSLTFLYRLVPNSYPRSHGIHVARLAGIPEDILCGAEKKARTYQHASNEVHTALRLQSLAKDVVSNVNSDVTDETVWTELFKRLGKLCDTSTHSTSLTKNAL